MSLVTGMRMNAFFRMFLMFDKEFCRVCGVMAGIWGRSSSSVGALSSNLYPLSVHQAL